MVLSAFVHAEHAVELLSSGQGIGYRLKDRVEDVTEFVPKARAAPSASRPSSAWA